ncbi:hypothetical protein TRFO_28259 [Tritrichomonas foetus]|uniref:BEACH domain-containing protein n=1 Tax=Tritrichomonas foetus TaxID=1144522 RepID=A0A1J4K006_9EUKA|nr:hypothetical protein TRFO_28259 [Tritrichomonas foetus]|eukprot:OHT04274.1 hypothetical protein TRFO_28259 [Tritrichomonas foetus]
MNSLVNYFKGKPINYLVLLFQTYHETYASTASYPNSKKKLSNIDKTSISKLSQELSGQNREKDSLISIGFNYDVEINELELLTSPLNVENPLEVEILVYFNVVSFLYFPENVEKRYLEKENQFNNVIEFLLAGLKQSLSTKKEIDKNMIKLNSMLFHDLIKLLIHSYKDHISEKSFGIIIKYLELDHYVLEKKFFPLFLELDEMIIKTDSKVLISEMLSVFYKCAFNNREFMDIENYKTNIIKLLDQYIKSFSSNALKIIAWMSKNAMCSQLNDVYIELPSILINHIKKSQLELKINSQKEFSDVEIPNIKLANKDNYNYDFIDKPNKSFPKGIEALPKVFFQTFEPLINIFDESTKNIINSLTDMLQFSDPSILVNFFKFFQYLAINQDSEEFPLVYAAYLILLRPVNIVKELLDCQFQYLGLPCIFNPKHLIFIDGYLNPIVNRFRNEIFDLLIYTDPDRLISLFKKSNPFLYAEHLGRILSKAESGGCDHDAGYSVFQKLAENEKFIEKVIKQAKILQQIDFNNHSDLVAKARNCIFLFTFHLARYKSFESHSFGPYFFEFLFENEITDIIIHIVEKYYISCDDDHNYDPVLARIHDALYNCANKSNNKLYSDLAIKLCRMITNCMHHNIHSINFFAFLFDVIIQNFIAKPSYELLEYILKIILFLSMNQTDFCPKVEYLNHLSSFIKKNASYDSVYTNFMCLLKNSTQLKREKIEFKNSQLFLIKRPQFLPFLFASYGKASFFNGILKKLIDCCKISWSNIINCHLGSVDTILLMFLQSINYDSKINCSTIFYNGLEIEISLSYNDRKALVYPLLSLMSSFKSSFSVASNFLKLCQTNLQDNYNLFTKSLINGNISQKPSIMISSLPRNSILTGLTGSFFKNSFTIAFWLRLDMLTINQSRSDVELFSISDTKMAKIVVFMNNGRILFRYDYNTIRTQVKLVDFPCFQWKDSRKDRIEPSSSWHFVVISFEVDPKGNVSLKTSLDYDKPIKSEMSKLVFIEGDLKVTIGTTKSINAINGHETKYPRTDRYELGYIADFRFIPRKLTKDEKYHISIGNIDFIADEISITSKSEKNDIDPQFLSLQFENVILLKEFIEVFRDTQSIDFLSNLKYIFEASEITQNKFISLIPDLVEVLNELNEQGKCNSHLYYNTYSILEAISLETLKNKWLEMILLNLSNWTNSKDLPEIITHWSTVIIANHSHFFEHTSLFLSLIKYFESKIFGSSSCSLFLKFMELISFINFEQHDSYSLFWNCFSIHDEKIIGSYLDLALNLTSVIHESCKQKFIQYSHIMFMQTSKTKIALKCLQIIHELSGENIYKEFTTSIILLKNKDITFVKKIFRRIIHVLPHFPNFFSIISNLSLLLDSDAIETAIQVLNEMRKNKQAICIEDEWYLWPLILVFNTTSRKNHQQLFSFISFYSRDSKRSIKQISYLLHLFRSCFKNHGNFDINEFYAVLSEKLNNPEIQRKVSNILVYITFWKLEQNQPSSSLLNLFDHSIFYETIDFSDLKQSFPIKTDIKNIDDLDALTQKIVSGKNDFPIYYCAALSSDERYILNISTIGLADQLISNSEKSEYSSLINYYKEIRNHQGTNTNDFGSTIEKMRIKFKKSFNKTVLLIFNNINNSVNNSKGYIDKLTNIKLMDKITDSPRKNKFFTEKNNRFDKIQKSTFLTNLCPLKINEYKETKTSKNMKELLKPDPKFFSRSEATVFKAKLIQLNKPDKVINFQIGQKGIYFFTDDKLFSRIIEMKQITLVLEMSSTAIEVFVKNNISYYFDFGSNPTKQSYIQYFPSDIVNFKDNIRFNSMFELIIKLNYLNGRSFHLKNKYPVFPQLFKDYEKLRINTNLLNHSNDKGNDINSKFTEYSLFFNESSQIKTINIPEIQNFDSVPPEFYFIPETINDESIPTWSFIKNTSNRNINNSISKYEFVAILRNLIETPKMSDLIYFWISNTFTKTFTNMTIFGKSLKNATNSICLNNEPLSYGTFTNKNGFLIVDFRGSISFFNKKTYERSAQYHLASLKSINFIKGENELIAFDSKNLTLTIFNSINCYQFPFYCETSLICQSKHHKIYYCQTKSTIKSLNLESILKANHSPNNGGHLNAKNEKMNEKSNKRNIKIQIDEKVTSNDSNTIFSKHDITGMTAASEFELIVYSTCDNCLHIVSEMKEICVHKFETRILHISITKASGYIIVQTADKIVSVFTLNGSLMTQHKSECIFTIFSPFVSKGGIDCIAYISENKDIGFFDAARPQYIYVSGTSAEAISIDYDLEKKAFVLITITGNAEIIPFNINPTEELAMKISK